MTRVIVSTSEAYFAAARQELARTFPNSTVERLGPDLGALDLGSLDIGEVAQECRSRPVVFVRHLMREMARIPLDSSLATVDAAVYEAVHRLSPGEPGGQSLALQVWASEPSPENNALIQAVLKRTVDGLTQEGFTIARAGQEHVLSVCVASDFIIVGLNRQADSLVDWPGGRVHLANRENRISRSEFKLEEALRVFDIRLPPQGRALDLGASPGGWTRILRQAGLAVWAVDPGVLDPRIAADPGVHHAKTTAGSFLATTDLLFDLLVNDMRITAQQTCDITIAASSRVTRSAHAILTLKISLHRPVETVERCLDRLRRSYYVLHARQLFHNRNEVTVIARRS